VRRGSLNLRVIVDSRRQGLRPEYFGVPVCCVFYLPDARMRRRIVRLSICGAESELTAVSHEYSSMKFAMFFMAEYANMIMLVRGDVVVSGGWTSPSAT